MLIVNSPIHTNSDQCNPQPMEITKRVSLLESHKRQVRLKTCGDVYEVWGYTKKRYAKAPKEGVEFEIDYIDTGDLILEDQPSLETDKPKRRGGARKTVLCLHGAPGSYHDFALLIHHLAKENVRVIAPNFPEYVATVKTKVLFQHSADEKAAYLRDFLRAINVSSIDLLISHSSAIFPTLLILLNANNEAIKRRKEAEQQQQQVVLQDTVTPAAANNCGSELVTLNRRQRRLQRKQSKLERRQRTIVKFEQPIEIKALALFNPAAHRLPMSMKPEWFKCGSVPIYQHKLGRSLFQKLGPAFLTVIGVPVKVDNMDNVMLSATVMRNSKCERLVKQLAKLSEMKLPTLLVFSENDKLIEKEIFYEMTHFMRLDQTKFDLFNNEGELELAQANPQDWCRVMVFKEGGHYAYSNYAKTVNKAVSELLEKVPVLT